MPEKKIDVKPTIKLIIFPTLNRIIKDAAIKPIPINGIELYINRAKKMGISKYEISIPKIIFPTNI